MYYYKYPIEGEEGQFIHIATTRPETMFGDTAVAVSKENEKLKHLIGKNAIRRLSTVRFRLSATSMPIPKKVPARLKLRRRMTSMTLRSANATTCR